MLVEDDEGAEVVLVSVLEDADRSIAWLHVSTAPINPSKCQGTLWRRSVAYNGPQYQD